MYDHKCMSARHLLMMMMKNLTRHIDELDPKLHMIPIICFDDLFGLARPGMTIFICIDPTRLHRNSGFFDPVDSVFQALNTAIPYSLSSNFVGLGHTFFSGLLDRLRFVS